MLVSTDAIYQYTVIYDLVFSHNTIASILFVAGERMRPKANMNPHMLGCYDITWQHRDSLTVLLHLPIAQADHTYSHGPVLGTPHFERLISQRPSQIIQFFSHIYKTLH